MPNTSCPTCGKRFHACSSCSLDHDWEYEFCSAECAAERCYAERDRLREKVRLLRAAVKRYRKGNDHA